MAPSSRLAAEHRRRWAANWSVATAGRSPSSPARRPGAPTASSTCSLADEAPGALAARTRSPTASTVEVHDERPPHRSARRSWSVASTSPRSPQPRGAGPLSSRARRGHARHRHHRARRGPARLSVRDAALTVVDAALAALEAERRCDQRPQRVPGPRRRHGHEPALTVAPSSTSSRLGSEDGIRPWSPPR